MPVQPSKNRLMSPEERTKQAKGKMILVVGIVMIALFFGLVISLTTYSLTMV